MLPDPFLSEARVGRCAILLEYEVVWQQAFTVLDELRKQIIYVEICIHLHLLWHEVRPSRASKASSCRHHDVRRTWLVGPRGVVDQHHVFCLLTRHDSFGCSLAD